MKTFAATAFLLFFTFPFIAHSARLSVEVGGSDSSSCGKTNSPCRSISQAIENANAGDTIVVGPGFYGGYRISSGSSELGGEFANNTSDAAVTINKPLRIISRAGARSTVIDAGLRVGYGVYITSPSVVFGAANKGFSVKGGTDAQVYIGAAQVTVNGNRMTEPNGVGGIEIGCDDRSVSVSLGRITNNSISGNGDSGIIFCENSSSMKITRNEITLNGDDGIEGDGNDYTITNNMITGNASAGISVASETALTIRGNNISGNVGSGIAVAGKDIEIVRNDIVGNVRFGIFTEQLSKFQRNNLIGNNPGVIGNFRNCGLLYEATEEISFAQNYWGAPGGPGSEGAQQFCSNVFTGNRNISGLNSPVRIRVKRPRN